MGEAKRRGDYYQRKIQGARRREAEKLEREEAARKREAEMTDAERSARRNLYALTALAAGLSASSATAGRR